MQAIVTGTGSYIPERVVTNAELSAMLGEDIDAFVSKTLGIRERRWSAPDESTVDMALPAAQRALESAGLTPQDIDLLIVATDTPEYISPSTSAVLQGRLGATNAATFDVNSACAGFVTALDIAWKYLRADDRYNRILIVGVYAMSKYLDQADKKTVTIFADGAGAIVLERSEHAGVLASELYADARCPAARAGKVETWARERGIAHSYDAVLDHPEIPQHVQAEVDAVNSMLSRPEQIKRFALLPFELSPGQGELTPTLKIRRAFVEQKYQQQLDSLYA